MQIRVHTVAAHSGELILGNRTYPCALGKSGVTKDKTEGDHASPAGVFPLRSVFYRKDKVSKPECSLPCFEITEEDGWCDDPSDPSYNRKITLPFPASHETLWRADDLYDLVVVLGHNDAPPVPGKGSCIFMHVAKDGYEGTEGCVAVSKQDLLDILKQTDEKTTLEISL